MLTTPEAVTQLIERGPAATTGRQPALPSGPGLAASQGTITRRAPPTQMRKRSGATRADIRKARRGPTSARRKEKTRVDNSAPAVTVQQGSICGSSDGTVIAFRGIPYAASPVGSLRFRPPAPHPGWSGVRDGSRPGPAAPQGPSRLEWAMGPREPDWDEAGCLNLNVWTPANALPDATPRPVLVWFHGGGFTSGSGGWDWYDGRNLAAAGNIVVVTANYRLGPLGYLRLPGIGADNLGCQDQAAVLRWTRDNIGAFGGDPAQVTVGGQSGGAYSALLLAIDPATSDLVHRVIAQ